MICYNNISIGTFQRKFISSTLILIVFFVSLASICTGEEKDNFSVALTGKYPPFSFYNSQGELVGFDVDVSRAIALHLDKELELVPTEWDGILAGLLADKYDAIIGSMAITPERAESVDFSIPYYISGAQLFIPRDKKDSIKSIEDCSGMSVGVVLGETYEHYLRNNYPDVNVMTYKSSVDIFQEIETGRLAGFVSDRLVGAWQIKNTGKDFIPAGELLFKEEIAIPVKKGSPELLENINSALLDMKTSGELNKLFEKWFGLGKENTDRVTGMATDIIAKKLLKGFAITLVVAIASLAIGFFFSIPCGLILNRQKGTVYIIMRALIDFIRGTPVLIQLFFVYFGAPQIGIVLSPITAAIFTLSVSSMAYMSEVVRSGLMSVDKGQHLAGRSLGFSKFQTFRLIIWPQAFRIAMPPLINSVVALTKDTALISIISVGEVIREAQSIISVTFDPIKYYLIVALMFFVVTFPLMKLAERFEANIKKKGFA